MDYKKIENRKVSDSETISASSAKRKHKLLQRPVLGVYMEDVYAEDTDVNMEDVYVEDIDDQKSVQNDDDDDDDEFSIMSLTIMSLTIVSLTVTGETGRRNGRRR
ncbi:hypothetical protein HPULCUR_002274 [Helicostylum pulchrum]|uniref:Uncharacterized protein n=1 Tax=Helicostylum pulchrum TaxID=562976 RepID=A0ABP9XQ20_9FUNG